MTVLTEDLLSIYKDENIDWKQFENKTICISGATGLIGYNLVHTFLYVNTKLESPCTIVAVVRNMEKAQKMFGCHDHLQYVVQDICEPLEVACDYMIHAASMTSSKDFSLKPVETIETAYTGTKNVLQCAKANKVEKIVYLSSMEVYGHPEKGHIVKEGEVAGFDVRNVRNSYPISKELCESLCLSYADEYNVNACVVRLTQTFGLGVPYHDGRVFAEFMRCAMEEKNIILKTKGETERCYLYTADAVRAIITLLLKGEKGEVYTAANPATYCSIAEMAEMVCHTIAHDKIQVEYQLQDIKQLGYASTLYMMLDVSKLEALGWKPVTSLPAMFNRMIQSQKEV